MLIWQAFAYCVHIGVEHLPRAGYTPAHRHT
jgi:hypothetical protein